ncbi:MAG TPA: hypothetical protein VFI19_01350 [Nocardioides sp.]|nr:hypothetical protein [Nocardioides sp.]
MNDAQTWTLIGGFFTLMVTMIALTLRTVRAEMRGEIGTLRVEMRGEIGTLRAEMSGRFDTVDARLDHLDSDMQAVVTRLMES